MDDGFMEVVGLFGAAQMAALQVGDTGLSRHLFNQLFCWHHASSLQVFIDL